MFNYNNNFVSNYGDRKTLHPLMTVQEASERLRLTKNTLNNWLSQGRIKRVKIGRRTFVARKEIEEILRNALQLADK